MKRITFVILVTCIGWLGCRKSGKDPILETSLLGRWNFTEYYYSTGGPGAWHDVEPENQVIEFKPDGSFVSSQSFRPGYTSYEIVDSSKVRFKRTSGTPLTVLMQYDFKIAPGKLVLSPLEPLCIEGCGSKFER